ncbi:unnamed protein product, partial [Polarella glacialis]
MLSELALCQRELSYRKAELAATLKRLEQEERQRSEALSALQADFQQLAARAGDACSQGLQEDLRYQRSLASSREQLEQMCSELFAAKRSQEATLAESKRSLLRQERRALETEVAETRMEVARETDVRDRLEHGAADAEAMLSGREQTVAEYETQAVELRE